MADDAVTIAEGLWARIGAMDWDGARGLMHDDYVQEWPQSGSGSKGRDDALAVNRNFPGGIAHRCSCDGRRPLVTWRCSRSSSRTPMAASTRA